MSSNIDSLAADGILFEQAVTVAASTPPAMAALMTGQLPHYQPDEIWDP